MRFDDEQSGLHLVVKDDLRQRDVNAWARSFREWREINGLDALPVGRLSNAEYNCGALYAAVSAGWIVESGRRPDDVNAIEGELVDGVPDEPVRVDDMDPPLCSGTGRGL